MEPGILIGMPSFCFFFVPKELAVGELSLKQHWVFCKVSIDLLRCCVFCLLQPGSLGSSMKKRWRKTLSGYSHNQQDRECLSASLPRLKPSCLPWEQRGRDHSGWISKPVFNPDNLLLVLLFHSPPLPFSLLRGRACACASPETFTIIRQLHHK